MAANYVLLGSQTVGEAGASSITFSNIPQTGYTDLKIVGSHRCDGASAQLIAKFNGSTTGYSRKVVYGDGSTASSSGGSAEANVRFAFSEVSTYTASTFASFDLYIPNYTSANHKSLSADSVSENNATGAEASLHAGLWANTAAITSINISDVSATNFVQYSSFYLYGLAAVGTTPVIAPFATGGNVTNDGTYWIHTFLASGTFTPAKTLSCDYLVVAGGGAGGFNTGGGGGAGGLRSTVTATGGGGSLETALSLTAQAYTVTVGAGGAVSGSGAGGNGNNSVFSTITSTAGGGGGGTGANAGVAGGSGGGAARGGQGSFNGGTGTANQGYAGGNNGPGSTAGGNSGGGGGAGAVGVSVTTTSGAGGAGVATSITGSSVTYAGGGGGGAYQNTRGLGGSGGGGNGAYDTSPAGSAGTANLGGGGGGGNNNGSPAGSNAGYAGGSGIVIVRYAMV